MKRLLVWNILLVVLTTTIYAGEIGLKDDGSHRTKKDISELKAAASTLNNRLRKSFTGVGGDYYLPPSREPFSNFGGNVQWQWGGCQCPPDRPFSDFDARPAVLPPYQPPTGFDIQQQTFVAQPAPAISSAYNPQYRPVLPQSIPNSLGLTSPGYYYDVPSKRFDT